MGCIRVVVKYPGCLSGRVNGGCPRIMWGKTEKCIWGVIIIILDI